MHLSLLPLFAFPSQGKKAMSVIRAVDSPLVRAALSIQQTLTSPVLSASLLAGLFLLPESSRRDLLRRLPGALTVDAALLKTILFASLGLGIVRKINQALTNVAHNGWRLSAQSNWDWPNEIAVVTGGSSGIGLEVVKRFLARGVKVAVIDISDLPEEMKGNGQVRFYKCDLTSTESVAAAAESIRREFGPPSILVNNAGIASKLPILESSIESVRRVFEVNCLSHWTTVQQFVPHMVRENKGHVVNVASVLSFVTLEANADYSASKAAALAFHEALSDELKRHHKVDGVLTTVVHPTFVRTPLIQQGADYLEKKGAILQRPEDVADAITNQVFSRRGAQLIVPGRAWPLSVFRALPGWLQESTRDVFQLTR